MKSVGRRGRVVGGPVVARPGHRAAAQPPKRGIRCARILTAVWVPTVVWYATVTGAGAALAAPSGIVQAPVMEDGRYLPANTWVQLAPVPTERFLPRNFTDCTQAFVRSHPAGRKSSSVFYGGTILYWGGAGGYYGNDVELFDIAANAWMQQYQPECIPACCITDLRCSQGCVPLGGTGTTEITPLGQPYTEHSFQLFAYNRLRKKYTAALVSGLWEWDPVTTGWTRLAPERPETIFAQTGTQMLVYDPDLQTVLYFATASNQTVFLFDYATSTWIPHSSIPQTLLLAGEIFSAYDSNEHKYLVSHGTRTTWIYDAPTGTWTQLDHVPADAIFPVGTGSGTRSMAYDPILGVFLLGKKDVNTNSVQLWSYRIATDTWTPLQVAGSPPRGSTSSYNGLVYDDIWKRFYFLNVRSVGGGGQGGDSEGDVETWAYRIGGPVGPGDANCDQRVTAADLPGLVAMLGPVPNALCGAVDLDRDGQVSAGDVSAAAHAIFRAAQ